MFSRAAARPRRGAALGEIALPPLISHVDSRRRKGYPPRGKLDGEHGCHGTPASITVERGCPGAPQVGGTEPPVPSSLIGPRITAIERGPVRLPGHPSIGRGASRDGVIDVHRAPFAAGARWSPRLLLNRAAKRGTLSARSEGPHARRHDDHRTVASRVRLDASPVRVRAYRLSIVRAVRQRLTRSTAISATAPGRRAGGGRLGPLSRVPEEPRGDHTS